MGCTCYVASTGREGRQLLPALRLLCKGDCICLASYSRHHPSTHYLHAGLLCKCQGGAGSLPVVKLYAPVSVRLQRSEDNPHDQVFTFAGLQKTVPLACTVRWCVCVCVCVCVCKVCGLSYLRHVVRVDFCGLSIGPERRRDALPFACTHV